MAKYIAIERPNGMVTLVRSIIETASEDPLTEHEEIINELYSKVKNLNMPAVVKSVCPKCKSDDCDNTGKNWRCNKCNNRWEQTVL